MTMEEIEEKYDGYWVCLTNIKEGKHYETLGGEVALASKNKEEVLDCWAGPHEGLTYFRYFGKLPESVGAFLL
jgi:hypothetical protein